MNNNDGEGLDRHGEIKNIPPDPEKYRLIRMKLVALLRRASRVVPQNFTAEQLPPLVAQLRSTVGEETNRKFLKELREFTESPQETVQLDASFSGLHTCLNEVLAILMAYRKGSDSIKDPHFWRQRVIEWKQDAMKKLDKEGRS